MGESWLGGSNVLAPARVDVPLIEGFAAGGSDFKPQALLFEVEEINFGAAFGADDLPNKLRTERIRGHEQPDGMLSFPQCAHAIASHVLGNW
jgi:hypothetical protein